MSSTVKRSFEGGEERLFRQVEGLKRLSQVINAYPSQQQALSEALKVVAETLQVEKCLLMRHDPRTNKLIPLVPTYGFKGANLARLHILLPKDYDYSVAEAENNCRVFAKAFYQTQPFHSNRI